jgi:tryptophan synthase alpha chain
VLELIRKFRETHETPIVLFTYLNPVFTYGFEAFHHDAAAAGANGVIVGSAIVRQVELHLEYPAQAVKDFTAPLIAAVKASRHS